MNPLESVKKHPTLAIGVGVAAVVVILIVASSGGGDGQTVSSGNTGGTDSAAIESGNQLQAMLASISGNVEIARIAQQSKDSEIAAALKVEEIRGQSTNAANSLAAQIAALGITSEAKTTQDYNTLQAGVINSQTQAQVEMQRIASNTTIQTTKTVADALTQQSLAQSGVAMAAAAKKCESYLFGLFSSC